jgi:hypothetical protein
MSAIDDRFAIHDLLCRYCFLIDHGRSADVPEEIFTEDVVEQHGSVEIVGREASRAFYGGYSIDASAHMLSNVVITLDGATARSLASVSAYHWLHSTKHLGTVRAADFTLLAMYEDEHRREPQGWRIARRVVHELGRHLAFGDIPEGIPLPEAGAPAPKWPS